MRTGLRRTAAFAFAAALLGSGAGPVAAQGRLRPDPAKTYSIPISGQVRGSADALVTIVSGSDFECPYCQRVIPTLDQIAADYGSDVRFVFMHNPIRYHKRAMPAAIAAECAGEQGRFWEFHDRLFAKPKELDEQHLQAYAAAEQLDVASWDSCVESKRPEQKIVADQAFLISKGAVGTPAFFINGRYLGGAQPIDRFKTLIDEELAKAKRLIASDGFQRSDYYEKVVVARGETKVERAPARPPARRRPPRPRTGPDPAKTYSVPIKGGQVRGSNKALVTVVEAADFQCPFCAKVQSTLERVAREYKNDLRLVYLHNPLGFHKRAMPTSIAAECAGDQGKFWEFHDLAYANMRALEDADLEAYASQLGLRMRKWRACVDGEHPKALILEQQKLLTSLGARGTPSFFINGRFIAGAQPFEKFQQLIDEELGHAKQAIKRRGVNRRNLYRKAIVEAGEKTP